MDIFFHAGVFVFFAADKAYVQHITQSLGLPDPVEVDRVLKDIFQEGSFPDCFCNDVHACVLAVFLCSSSWPALLTSNSYYSIKIA